MNEKIFKFADLEIWKRDEHFFARYDVGTHQIVIREDEISAEDAARAIQSEEAATRMLFELQKRLIKLGIDPYVSNVED